MMSEQAKSTAKSAAKQRYLRENYVRFPLDLRPDVLEKFRNSCSENGTTATTEIKRFINEYISENENK